MKQVRDIDWYIERAKMMTNTSSNRKLGTLLKISEGAMSQFKTRRVLPSDDTMIKLAELAQVDPDMALLDLNMWRSQGAAQEVYRKMLEKITAVAIAGVLIAIGATTSPAHAKVNNNCDTNPQLLYIMETIA